MCCKSNLTTGFVPSSVSICSNSRNMPVRRPAVIVVDDPEDAAVTTSS